MSIENAMGFFEKVRTDQDLKSKYQDILGNLREKSITEKLVKTVEQEVISLAKSAGYDFSVEELKDYKKIAPKQLSEEELDMIVGGRGEFEENMGVFKKTHICNCNNIDTNIFKNHFNASWDNNCPYYIKLPGSRDFYTSKCHSCKNYDYNFDPY
jgi:hypothetical protein